MSSSETIRIGRQLRALRRRRGLRQADVAASAKVAQTTISLVERGHGDRIGIGTLSTIAAELDARLTVGVSWRAGDLDRLTDAGHAAIATSVAQRLRAWGWIVNVEVTFAFDKERGSIDLLAWHGPTATLLVVEIKTELTSMEAMLRSLDIKVRRAPIIARRFSWKPVTIGRLVVMPESGTARRRARQLMDLTDARTGADGRAIRAWLRAPAGPLDGVWLTSGVDVPGRRGGTHRVRRGAAAPSPASTGANEAPSP